MNALTKAACADRDLDAGRVLLEIRHARLRLQLVDVELEWAAVCLAQGRLTPGGGLELLNDAMGVLADGGS